LTETVGQLLLLARRRLAAAPFRPSTREANLLLGYVLHSDEAHLLAHPELTVAADAVARFLDLLNRRMQGEPVAYLRGERDFFGRPFAVDRRVLVPRPETEHLVETALESDLPPRPRILELGTGSGCVAITLALELPEAWVVAADISPAALAVTTANIAYHQVKKRVAPVAADLVCGLRLQTIDLVVANLPYIALEDGESISPEVREYEPATALFAPKSGLGLIMDALQQLSILRTGTPILLEIGSEQADTLEAGLEELGYLLTAVHADYAGIPRVLALERR